MNTLSYQQTIKGSLLQTSTCQGEWQTKTIRVFDLPADQWSLFDLKVENGRASYKLAYNAVSSYYSCRELWTLILYNRTYDNPLYSHIT